MTKRNMPPHRGVRNRITLLTQLTSAPPRQRPGLAALQTPERQPHSGKPAALARQTSRRKARKAARPSRRTAVTKGLRHCQPQSANRKTPAFLHKLTGHLPGPERPYPKHSGPQEGQRFFRRPLLFFSVGAASTTEMPIFLHSRSMPTKRQLSQS